MISPMAYPRLPYEEFIIASGKSQCNQEQMLCDFKLPPARE